jgi:branched-chain amino acid transport system ATP-binding protein
MHGLIQVPEGRKVFPNLSVHENLELGAFTRGRDRKQENLHKVYAIFPRLKERVSQLAGTLSGGEQQMLTLCRTLMGDPDLIIIDEPTEGLAPKIVELVGAFLKQLKTKGVSVLLIEQKLTIAMDISDRVLVMGHGSIVFTGTPAELKADTYIRREWLEV